MPLICRLTVDRIFSRTVLSEVLLAIHGQNRPAIVAQCVALGIEQVQFSHGGKGLSILRAQRFQAEPFSRGGPFKGNLLGVTAGRKGALIDRRQCGKVQADRRMERLAEIFFGMEIVQYRLYKTADFGPLRTDIV